ncbi:MAG: 2TM domain-containing protein [Blastococcus sp.]
MPPIDDTVQDEASRDPTHPERRARQQAMRQTELRRKFHGEVVVSAVGMLIVVLVWATSEYRNAGGWPTEGFSESSGIPNVWNFWIVYALLGWLLFFAARARAVSGHRPISEEEIERENERQSGTPRR